MDGGAWKAAVHGVAKLDMTERLHFHFSLPCIGEGNGNPLHCSFLEDPRDGGAWWAAVYGVTQSRTRLKRQQQQAAGCLQVLYKHHIKHHKGTIPMGNGLEAKWGITFL